MSMLRWPVLLALCPLSFAQVYSSALVKGAPEELSINEIRFLSDPEVKLLFLESFPKRYPNSTLLPWVYDQTRSLYEARKRPEKVAELSEAILKILPDDLYSVHLLSRHAEETADAAASAKWTSRLQQLVPQALASGEPEQKALAAQIAPHLDYAAYMRIAKEADPKKRLARIEAFLEQSPGSAYLTHAANLYIQTCLQLGDRERSIAMVSRILDRDPDNAEMLAILLDAAYHRKDAAKTIELAKRLIDVLNRDIRPEGVEAAAWARRRGQLQGSAFWMLGSTEMTAENYAPADAALRSALPFLREQRSPFVGAALYYLGWANYRLGRAIDSIRFNRDCAALQTAYQARCQRNLQVVLSESSPKQTGGSD